MPAARRLPLTPEQIMAAKRAEFPGTETNRIGQNFTGTKWHVDRDVAEIAKLVRAEIRELVGSGMLPKLKAQVRIQRYSGGQSVKVTITDMDIGATILAPKAIKGSRFARSLGRPIKAKAAQALERIDQLLSSYNYDWGDSMSDYYRVNFAQDVGLDYALLDKPTPEQAKPVVTRWDLIG